MSLDDSSPERESGECCSSHALTWGNTGLAERCIQEDEQGRSGVSLECFSLHRE